MQIKLLLNWQQLKFDHGVSFSWKKGVKQKKRELKHSIKKAAWCSQSRIFVWLNMLQALCDFIRLNNYCLKLWHIASKYQNKTN